MNKITNLINISLKNSNLNVPIFQVTNGEEMSNDIIKYLMDWNGGRTYKIKIETEKECWKQVRKHWNRQKAQRLGDHLFFPIFCNLWKVQLLIHILSKKKKLTH